MRNYLELSDLFHEPSLEERLLNIAARIRKVRRRKKLSQAELADRSFVSLGSIRRFEQTGQISFESLYRIAISLGCGNELDQLFSVVPLTYEEIENA